MSPSKDETLTKGEEAKVMSGLYTPAIRTDLEAQRLVREWIAALRSGKYVQGTGCLRACDVVRRIVDDAEKLDYTDCKWCCLGVVCDVVDPQGWRAGTPMWTRDPAESPEREVSEFSMDGDHGSLPARVRIKLCISAGDGSFDRPVTSADGDPSGMIEDSLVNLNDSDRFNFEQIADVVERELAEALA